MTHILDTDTFTLAYFDKAGVRGRVAAQPAGDVAVSVVTHIEVLRGRFAAVLTAADGPGVLRAHQWLLASQAYLDLYPTIPFDTAAADNLDRLLPDKQCRKIGRADLLIACIALAHAATLVTRNTKDFRLVTGLNLENWAD